MANAPYCNVKIATPAAKPASPKGIQSIPASATQQQMVNIINNNFQNLLLGNYVENRAARQTQIVRVFDPNDSSSYVDVRQVVAVQFVNQTTGQVINWKR